MVNGRIISVRHFRVYCACLLQKETAMFRAVNNTGPTQPLKKSQLQEKTHTVGPEHGG